MKFLNTCFVYKFIYLAVTVIILFSKNIQKSHCVPWYYTVYTYGTLYSRQYAWSLPRVVSWIPWHCWACRGTWPLRSSSAGWWSSRDQRWWRTAELWGVGNRFGLQSRDQRWWRTAELWNKITRWAKWIVFATELNLCCQLLWALDKVLANTLLCPPARNHSTAIQSLYGHSWFNSHFLSRYVIYLWEKVWITKSDQRVGYGDFLLVQQPAGKCRFQLVASKVSRSELVATEPTVYRS